ncbi:MAG TPA: hypothetical protein VIL18_01135 [Longimicrobiales bacterium]
MHESTGHTHRVARAELDMRYSGYDPQTRGYVYGYREWCDCGAVRSRQYRTAAEAEEAHRGIADGTGGPR